MINQVAEKFELYIQPQDSDDENVDQLTRKLRKELFNLDIQNIEFLPKEQENQKLKGIDPVILGALVLTITPNLVSSLIEFLHDWILRQKEQKISIKLVNENGASIEIDVPAGSSYKEIEKWAKSLSKLIKK